MPEQLFREPSDMAKALAATAPVTEFEGRAVTMTTVKVNALAKGISATLSIDPVKIEHGQEVYFVVRAMTDDVTHKCATGQQLTDPHHTLERKVVFIPAEVAIVHDPTAAVPVTELLHQQVMRFEQAEEAAKEVQAETGSDGWQDEIAEHTGGDDDGDESEDPEDGDSFEAGTTGRPRLAAVASGGGGDMYDDPDDETL